MSKRARSVRSVRNSAIDKQKDLMSKLLKPTIIKKSVPHSARSQFSRESLKQAPNVPQAERLVSSPNLFYDNAQMKFLDEISPDPLMISPDPNTNSGQITFRSPGRRPRDSHSFVGSHLV